MKLYNLFIATFFVLVNFSIGAPVDDDELGADIYFSYEDNVSKLKVNKLDYLVKDLDRIYEMGYEMAKTILEFVEDNQELMEHFEGAMEDALMCVEDNLMEALENHKDQVEDLIEILEETPENSTCYKDLLTYFEEVKESVRESLVFDEIVDMVNKFVSDVAVMFEKLEDVTMVDVETLQQMIDDLLDDYVEEMIAFVNENSNKEDVQKLSAKAVDGVKKIYDENLEFLKKNGILNKNVVKNSIKEYEKIEELCEELNEDIYYENIQTLISTYAEIDLIEEYASAKFYIVDDQNNKKLLDCDDHIPFYNERPTENRISQTIKTDFHVTGTNKNGQDYKRNVTVLEVDGEDTEVNEIIEYDNKVFDRKYIVELPDDSEEEEEEEE